MESPRVWMLSIFVCVAFGKWIEIFFSLVAVYTFEKYNFVI